MSTIREIGSEITYTPLVEAGKPGDTAFDIKDTFQHTSGFAVGIMDPKNLKTARMGSATTTAAGAGEITKQWEVSLGGEGVGTIEPVIRAEGVFVSANGTTRKYSYDGKEAWGVDTGGNENTIPIFDKKGNVYVQGGNSLTSIAPDGTTRWIKQIGRMDTCGVPVFVKNDIVGINRDGTVACYDTNGRRQWKTSVKDAQMEQPVVDKHDNIHIECFARGRDKRHVVLDTGELTDSGSPRVKLTGFWGLLQTPLVDQKGTVYGFKDGRFRAQDSEGKQLWSMDLPVNMTPTLFETPSLVYTTMGPDGNLYIVAGNKALVCSKTNGKELWSFKGVGEDDVLSCNIAWGKDGTTYITGQGDNDEGRIYAINPDGSLKWWKSEPSGITGVKVGSDGYVVTCGDFDPIRIFSPQDGTRLLQTKEEIGYVYEYKLDDKQGVYVTTSDGRMARYQYQLPPLEQNKRK